MQAQHENPSLASIISSLVAAFASGREVFRRLLEKHRARKLRRKDYTKLKDNEKLLHDSLSQNPKRIQDELGKSTAKFGKQFWDGDDIANTSLAHILVRLNTGLVNVIETFLLQGPKDHRRAQGSLLTLSESTASQTLEAFGDLQERLSRRGTRTSGTSTNSKEISSKQSHHGSSSTSGKKATVSGPRFVRSKSSSTILIETPKKPGTAEGQPRRKRKRKHSSSSAHTREAEASSFGKDAQPLSGLSRRSADPEFPQMQPTTGSDRRPSQNLQKRPISTMTFKSGSTKIGEIPEERWQAARVAQGTSNWAMAQDDSPLWWPPLQVPEENKQGIGSRLKFWRRR